MRPGYEAESDGKKIIPNTWQLTRRRARRSEC
jgi:hypothetical protein